jgi:RNA polymerase sigma factor (sigma-70 family)
MAVAPVSATHTNISCNEHELVGAVRRGDDRAFEELYSRYRARISSYIFGMLGDHGRAEDIAQEVFISALRRLRDTERPIAFKPWIYEIAKNACIDEFRRTRRAREVPLEQDESSDAEITSWRPGPDAAVANKQSLDDLRGAFHGLSESHHKILVMRELEGLSYGQIGEKLGMSRPMVESTLFRARKKLSEEYEELVSGRRCDHVQTLIASDQRRSLLKLGVRERRQLARHLAHCQPCRREARMAGVDESFFKAPKTLAGKIAALLPFPWLRWRRSHGGGSEDAAVASGPHSWNLVQGLQTVARLGDPTGPASGLGRAAAAAAAIAVAGVGGGVAVTSGGGGSAPHRTPAIARSAAATHRGSGAGGLSSSRASGLFGSQQQASAGVGRAAVHGAGASATGTGRTGSSGNGTTGATQQGGASQSSGSGGTGANAGSGPSGVAASTTGTVSSKLPSLSSPNLPSPQLPSVNLPKPQLPSLQLPKIQLPKIQVPTIQVPKVQVPKVSVPGVSVPDPNKLLKHLLGGG